MVEKSIENKIIRLVEGVIPEKPGLLQTDIKDKLKLTRDETILTLQSMVNENKIKVMKIGKAKLYFPSNLTLRR